VKQPVTLALRQEAEAFALRFSCEDCCHCEDSSAEPSCSLGFPADLRRDALAGEELAFCKSFELA
jgi:hypothetical protein